MIDYSTINESKLCRIIEKEVENDFLSAKHMLSFLDRKTRLIEYEYLYGLIMEKETYANYSDRMKSLYNEYIDKGIEALKKCDFSQAYNLFSAGYDKTKNSIFNYYMGKALFKSNNKRAAYPYFIGYTRFGGSKLPKALLYTMSAYCEIGNEKQARKYYKQLNYINKTFNHHFELCSPFDENGKLKYVNNKLEENFFYDKSKALDFDRYYEYDFSGKILIIESLFRHGKYSVANNLLKELKPRDKEQRKKIQVLVKNKVLYKNKMSN